MLAEAVIVKWSASGAPQRPDLQAPLDALVALGLPVAFDVKGERRWRAAGRVAA